MIQHPIIDYALELGARVAIAILGFVLEQIGYLDEWLESKTPGC